MWNVQLRKRFNCDSTLAIVSRQEDGMSLTIDELSPRSSSERSPCPRDVWRPPREQARDLGSSRCLRGAHVKRRRACGAPAAGSMRPVWHRLGLAWARLMGAGHDIYPLHHAEILVRQRVAMHHKAAGRDGAEVD